MSTATARQHCELRSISGSFGEWHDDREKWKGCRERFISTAKDFEMPFLSVLEKAARRYESIAIDADVLGGTPRIKGTRIPVYMILDAIEHYGKLTGALKSYPDLTMPQVKDAVSFAAEVLEHPVEHEP